MSIVSLVSGGLDSTLVAFLIKEEGVKQSPLFINYNQINFEKEYSTCITNFESLALPKPQLIDIKGYGQVIKSGLTSRELHIHDEAFLPGRNLMFLLLGSAYAYQQGADSVAIGLLDESLSLFPDQKKDFIGKAESLISLAIGKNIEILTPLINFNKSEVVALAKKKGISGTYSCHAGGEIPCGVCIACKEYLTT